jgi:uncharacterized membrane protein YfhO
MKKVKIIAGICWAFAGLILIIILFPGLNGFSVSVSKLPFMKLNPRYTGGEISSRIISESCSLDIRKPVFNGFLKDRKSGFVQLDWRGNVPETINDTIDYNNDGISDFSVIINRKDSKTELASFNPLVKKVDVSTPTSYGWAIRVELKRDNLNIINSDK